MKMKMKNKKSKNIKYRDNTQRTFAFIKPDAFPNAEEIKKRIVNEGFTIVKSRRITLTREQASLFYTEHTGKPFFDDLISYMTSGNESNTYSQFIHCAYSLYAVCNVLCTIKCQEIYRN